MADDLEAFLKRAAARRAQQRKSSARPPQPRPATAPPVRTSPPPVRAESIPPRMRTPPPADVDRQFARRSHQMEVETEQLGRDVEQEDIRLEAHMHDTFDHRVGELDEDAGFAGDLGSTTPKRDDVSLDLIALLRNPASIRNAVLLSEILQRPEHRW